MSKPHICLLIPVYNEVGNISELYERITAVMSQLSQYTYEIRVIDNCSTDGTRTEIMDICSQDKRFKAIFNVRNFGPVRSPIHNLYQAEGDAVISLCADLQDPPELIPEFLKKWEEGFKLVMGVRTGSEEKGLMPWLRKGYYTGLSIIADAEQLPGATGFGLYDREVIQILQTINDPYPYLRGLICELGWPIAKIPFYRPERKRGLSSYNFLRYMEEGMLGVVTQSRMPLHIIALIGITVCGFSALTAIYYLFLKIFYWDSFQIGLAPAVIGIFFLLGLLFLVVGIIGEYVGLIATQVLHRPLVIEERRINFLSAENYNTNNDKTNTLTQSKGYE